MLPTNGTGQFRQAIKLAPIRILVWGPGSPNRHASPVEKLSYKKRLRIRREIKKRFSNAVVQFSEDKDVVREYGWIDDQLTRQALQARSADLIIILNIGRGSSLEIDHFIETYDWFPSKAYILLPEQYVDTKGLVRTVFDKLPKHHIFGFSQKELDECKVATEKAIHITMQVATKIWLDAC